VTCWPDFACGDGGLIVKADWKPVLAPVLLHTRGRQLYTSHIPIMPHVLGYYLINTLGSQYTASLIRRVPMKDRTVLRGARTVALQSLTNELLKIIIGRQPLSA